MFFKYTRDFEKPIEAIEKRIEELKLSSASGHDVRREEIEKLEQKAKRLIKDIYSSLTPWQITLVARHPSRPYTLDYVQEIFEDFVELHGDRLFKDDPAIVGGLARLDGRPVVVIGQQKGRNTKERCRRNYGMPHPEGYRKALRLMELAGRFNMPLVTLIDTPGAAPDIEAEERGQAEAIARNLLFMSRLEVPIVSAVIGEGGSGGALAIGVADRVMMFEYSIYSVISPEGCAAILWKDGTKADLAAKALRMSAFDLMRLGVIDRIVGEPLGGAHRDPKTAAMNLKSAILDSINELSAVPSGELLQQRYDKFRRMGVFNEPRR
ncbi:MAG: acetyl-CoA carboxylase carboxyltransferase subunit alpha [Deltaproteobacteria bacterium]|nr:acetyl-CoA carboxylase carboxyltransferase subunit alpha [Deltaproteobacteria bacterium]